MAGRDIFDFKTIMQRGDDLFYVAIGCNDEMKSAGDEMDVRIDRCCRLHNLVDTGMRTTNYDEQPVRRVDGEGQLTQFERARFLGHKGNEMEIWRQIGVLVDQLKISSGPG